MNTKEILQAFAYVILTTTLCLTLAYGCNSPQNSSSHNTSSSNSSQYSTNSNNSNYSKHTDDSSTKWKEFAGTTYKASEFLNNDVEQHYAFSYSRSGSGTYIIFGTIPGTHAVTDQMEFNIYKVESDANCLYLYCSELSTPVKIKIKGHSLYTYDGKERYSEWD